MSWPDGARARPTSRRRQALATQSLPQHARIQRAQLHAQDGGLHFIEPAVHALDGADVALAPAILPHLADASGELVVVRW